MDIRLLDSRIIPSEDIRLERNKWQFTRISSGEDLTKQIRRVDKETFAGYDNAAYNRYLSGGLGAEELPTNVTGIFTKQILTDPLAAPADAASKAVDSVKAAVKSPWTWAAVGLVVVVLVVIYVPKPR